MNILLLLHMQQMAVLQNTVLSIGSTHAPADMTTLISCTASKAQQNNARPKWAVLLFPTTERVGLAVSLSIRIREVLTSILGRDIGYPE
jgi:hypothetical protein